MAVDAVRLLTLCREIESTPHDMLRELNREDLLILSRELKALRQEIDKVLFRIAFVDEQQLN